MTLPATATPATRLRAMREALDISQAELARRMHLDQSLVSRAERNLIRTWPRFRRDAAGALGIAEALLFPDGPQERVPPVIGASFEAGES